MATHLEILTKYMPKDLAKMVVSYNTCHRNHTHNFLCSVAVGDYDSSKELCAYAPDSLFRRAVEIMHRKNFEGIIKFVEPEINNGFYDSYRFTGACQGNHKHYIYRFLRNSMLNSTTVTLGLVELVRYSHIETLMELLDFLDPIEYDINWITEECIMMQVDFCHIDKLINLGANDIYDFFVIAATTDLKDYSNYFQDLMVKNYKYS